MPRIKIQNRSDLEKITKINGVYNLTAADLQKANLPFIDLQGAVLRKANLARAHLPGAKLQGAKLQQALLMGTELGGANLTGADLQGADLRSVQLESAILTGADLRKADLDGAYLLFADLRGADLRGAKNVPKNANLTDAILKNEDLEKNEENNVWVSDEQCVGKEDPIGLDPIPDNKGFRLKADELTNDPDNLINCFNIDNLATMVKRDRTLNKPLLSPRTRKPIEKIDLDRINNYIELNPTVGGRKKRKTNKRRKTKKTNKRKNKTSRKMRR